MDAADAGIADRLYAGAQSGVVDAAIIGDNDDLARGSDLQMAVLERWRRSGHEVGGWKVGLTAREGRDSMGKGFRPFGYILADRMFSSGEVIERSKLSICSVEPELCFTVGRELVGGAVTRDDVRRAVVSVAPALEIKERRLPPGVSGAIRLADNLKQWGIVYGDDHDIADGLPEPLAEVYCNDQRSQQVATGNDLDDHFGSIALLCEGLAGRGLAIAPGHRVITGSLTAAHLVGSPATWRANFPNFGEVAVSFV